MTPNPNWRDLGGEVDELHRTVERLATLVEQVATSVTEHLVTTGRAPAPSWFTLPTHATNPSDTGGAVAEVARVVEELSGWLATVLLRYPDAAAVLPECWLWHPDLVEELVWLSHAWHAAYTGPTASPAAAGDWHDRYRPGVIERLKRNAAGCSLERHSHPAPPVEVPVPDAAAAIASWWATHRDSAAPVPTTEDYRAAQAWHDRATPAARRPNIRTA